MEESQVVNKELGSLSIRDIFFKYVRFLPVFLISIAVSLLGAFLYLRYTTPIYRASGTITFIEEQGRGDKLDEIFNSNKTQDVLAEIEVLKSKPLMDRVVKSLNLQTTYNAVGKIKTLNIYKNCPFRLDILEVTDSAVSYSFNIKFAEEQKFQINNEPSLYSFGQQFKNAYGRFVLEEVPGMGSIKGKEFNVSWNPSLQVASWYAPMIRVSPKIVGSNIYNIAIDISNQQLGIDIINQLMKEYQGFNLEEKNRATVGVLAFVNDRLEFLQNDIDSIKSRLRNYRKENGITNIELQSENYFATMTEAENVAYQTGIKLEIAKMIEDYLLDKQNSYDAIPSALNLEDLTLNGLIEQYNQLQFERKKYIDSHVPAGNPFVQQTTRAIEQSRLSLLENIKNVKKSYQAIINDNQRRSDLSESQVKQIPEKEQKQQEIVRDLEIKENLYKFLLEEKEKTSMQQASNLANSKILEEAVGSGSPIKPNRRGIQLLSFIIGLGLPAMLIFFLELINDKIYTRYDIEKITDAAVLGEVGHSYSSSVLVVSKTNRSMVAEQFRIVRSNLQYVLNQVEKPVILVTSSFSGEGKSFVTTNLAGVMGLAGRKTVILEFDIRNPKILSGLRMNKKVGISNYLVGKATLEELPEEVPGCENLFVISCGPVPPNPSELLLEKSVANLFAWLKENFDVVIIDTAPVGMVSDAMTLGKFANATLYIVRQGYTYKKQIGLIDEFYRGNRLPKISIIINDVKLRPGYGYYGYGRYGYGYGYSGGYYDLEKDNRSVFKRIFSFTWFARLFNKK
ncbi:MAG: polysaccharide biosynthesis tyrosine autokinase [Terrimonas sp.]|nr:polysaccharide biosynthesis tyrosine autokinase [Terrimonas sp.]